MFNDVLNFFLNKCSRIFVYLGKKVLFFIMMHGEFCAERTVLMWYDLRIEFGTMHPDHGNGSLTVERRLRLNGSSLSGPAADGGAAVRDQNAAALHYWPGRVLRPLRGEGARGRVQLRLPRRVLHRQPHFLHWRGNPGRFACLARQYRTRLASITLRRHKFPIFWQ